MTPPKAPFENPKYLTLQRQKVSMERAVLGTIMMYNAYPIALDYIDISDFSSPRTLIFKEIEAVFKKNHMVDTLTVYPQLAQRPHLKGEFSKCLKAETYFVHNLPHHAMVLVETNIRLATYKNLMATVCEAEVLQALYHYAADVIDGKNDLFKMLSIGREFISKAEIETDVVENSYATLNEKIATLQKNEGLRMLLQQLDRYAQHNPTHKEKIQELFATFLKD